MALVLSALIGVGRPARPDDVTIRARTTLQLELVPRGRQLTLSGALRDNVFQGLGERVVTLEIDTAEEGRQVATVRRDLTTDRNGHFAWTGLLDDGAWEVVVFFGGGDVHAPAGARTQVSIAREPLAIALEVPRASPLWARLPVRVIAVHPRLATSGLSVRVGLGGRVLDAGTVLDEHGRLELAVERLPGPGRRLVEATLVGNHVFAPVTVSATVQVYGEAELTVSARVDTRHDARLLGLRGQLDSDGGPLADLPVHVRVEGTALEAEASTDAEGRFQLTVPIDDLDSDADYRVLAWVDPWGTPVPDLRLETEAHFALEGGPLVAAGRWGSLLAAILIAGIGLALGGRRARAWWVARRAARAQAQPPGRAAPRGLIELAPQRRGARATQTRVTGRVRDADTAEPLGLGTVVVALVGAVDAERVFPVATDGSFSTEPLAPGNWDLRVEASGYASTRTRLAIPHNGRYTDVEIYLCSVRSWVRFLYREMTVGLLLRDDNSHHWGRATPRQLEALLVDAYRAFVSERPTASGLTAFREDVEEILNDPSSVPSDRVLRALTLLVEEVYYSGRSYPEDLIALTRSLIEGVEATLQAVPG